MSRIPLTHAALMLTALSLLPLVAHADTVVLTNGQEIEGEIVERNDDAVMVKVEYGVIKIERNKILEIEKLTPEELARREAAAERKRLYEEAMAAAGNVKYKGQWIKQEEYDQLMVEKKEREAEEAARKAELKAKKEAELKKKKEAEAKRLAAQKKALNEQLDRRGDRRDRMKDSRRNSDNNDRNSRSNRSSRDRNSMQDKARQYLEGSRRR